MLITDKIIKLAGIVAIAVIIACVVFFIYAKVFAPSDVQKLTPDEIKRPELVADKLNVSDKVGKEIIKKIETANPVETYIVPAKEAPEKVRQIVKDKPADKTIIVDKDEKTIDVIKINLDRAEIGIGLVAVPAANYVGVGPVYQNKGLILSGGYGNKGAYIFVAKTKKINF
jgi:hypothetical protein